MWSDPVTALEYATTDYDGLVFEAEHKPWHTTTPRESPLPLTLVRLTPVRLTPVRHATEAEPTTLSGRPSLWTRVRGRWRTTHLRTERSPQWHD
ncbi:hypothetical protein [Streptomyces sp. AC512_CC834]|uniref:hypothetical protein n=1 Tax=Streptomyces sp. AC512_CC834 TaxID=2823691 RepID=UPI001C26091E|nr:hypothetical protein [Streptomyces sp. AC512_CC834]